jgi:cyclophilin family peptidyl-prolyl cis-trans isomerase
MIVTGGGGCVRDLSEPKGDGNGEAIGTLALSAPPLDGAYTVSGEVTSGMEVVDKIAHEEVDGTDRPLRDTRIFSAHVPRRAQATTDSE